MAQKVFLGIKRPVLKIVPDMMLQYKLVEASGIAVDKLVLNVLIVITLLGKVAVETILYACASLVPAISCWVLLPL